MIPLNPDRTAFGRHETFPLRFGWLTKGHQAWSENHAVFEQDEATVTLGVGKNMVSAIKYWMLATQIVKHDKTEECLIAKLEEMIAWLPGQLQLRESAGIHELYRLADIAPLEILQRHYKFNK